MAAAFISATSGVADRSVTVPSGADLMVVAVISTDVTARTAASFDGNALSIATNANDYTSIFYLLAPTVSATAALLLTPNTNVGADGMVVAFYSTDTSGFTFQSGQQASVGSASYSPSGAAVIVHGISATSAGTPVASTNERIDSGAGTWYGDRIVTGSGSVTVGATISDPDYGGAIFLEASAGQSITTAAFAAQAATMAATTVLGHPVSSAAFSAAVATMAATAVLGHPISAASFTAQAATMAATTVLGHPVSAAAFAAGSASMSATTVLGHPISTAAFAAGAATMAAEASVSGNRDVTSAAFAAQSATMAAEGTVVGNRSVTSAAFASGSATMAASAAFTRSVTGAAFASGSASFAATAAITTERTISVASFAASSASMSATLTVPVLGIVCAQPRPKLNLPGYTPARLAWRPPAIIAGLPANAARALQQAFQGIYQELTKVGQRRTIVPLYEDLDAREGQIIVGVGVGQTVTLPSGVENGELGNVRFVLEDVSSPVTVVHPDGSTFTLDEPGVYDVTLTPDSDAWQGPPGLSSGGSASGAGYLVDAAHGSLPNARVATDSAEIDAVTTTPGVVSWALNVASVGLSKLADLTGLSVVGRAASAAGAMAAITATGARQALMSNAAGTAIGFRAIEAADVPAHTWAETLAASNNSGANNPHVDDGQFLSFGVEGSIPASGDIRSSDALTINVTGAASMVGSTQVSVSSDGNGLAATPSLAMLAAGTSGVVVNDSTSVSVLTGGAERLEIEATGAWQVGGAVGSANQVLKSNGAGTPPTWQDDDDTTYSAGDGIDLTGTTFSVDVTDIVDNVTITEVATNNLQRAALTGFAAASAGSNATTSAEPIVTFSASANMSNERVLSAGTNTTISTAVAGQISVGVDDYPLSGLADQAANTIVANATGSSAAPTAVAVAADSVLARVGGNLVSHPWATLAGTYLSYSAGVMDWLGLDVRVNSGANVGLRRRLNVIGSSPITVGAADDAGSDEVDVTISVSDGAIALAKMANLGAGTVIGRQVDAGTGVPVALTGAQVGEIIRLGTEVADTTSSGSVPLVAINPGTNLMTFNGNTVVVHGITAPANPGQLLVLRHIGAGTATLVQDSTTATNTTDRLNLGDYGQNTSPIVLGAGRKHQAILLCYFGSRWQWINNAIADAAIASANLIDDVVTDAKLRNSAALSVIGRSANSTGDPADIAAGTDGHVLRRSGTTLGFGTIATAGIANDAVTNAIAANMAQSTIKGRAEGAGTGDPTDLTPTQVVAIIDGESPTWTGSHAFTSTTHAVTTTGDTSITGDGGLWLGSGHTVAAVGAGDVVINATSGIAITSHATVPVAAVTAGSIVIAGTVLSATTTGDITLSAGVDLTLAGATQVQVTSPFRVGSQFTLDNIISPVISASQNNWNPSGFSTCNIIRVENTSGGPISITGFAARSGIFLLCNISDNVDERIDLPSESGSSSTANRLLHGTTSLSVGVNDNIWVWYDSTSQRFRPIQTP